MYENNFSVLQQIVDEKSVIRHVSKHRKPDGTMDIDGNKKIWNTALERFEQIQLWENGAPNFDDRDNLQMQPSIAFIPAQNKTEITSTIIVAHGGGFETRTGCEGMHIAHYFAMAGFNTAILNYRIKPYSRRDAIADMQRAIRTLRAKKQQLGINDKITVMGFSAGGMLSGNCATHYDLGDENSQDPIELFSCRPDAAVLGYGAFATIAFPGSFFFNNPFVDKERSEKVYLAPERNVTCDTPPFFIWQTISDDARNAFVLSSALTEVGVPFELHCFQDGVHGLALADGNNDLSMDIPHVAKWASLCAEWLHGLEM